MNSAMDNRGLAIGAAGSAAVPEERPADRYPLRLFVTPPLRFSTAFSLVELLVVVTIIAVLLALLTPALDKAIYQAELAACGSQLRAISSGASIYAFDYKRRYPYRPGVEDLNTPWRINKISQAQSELDDRPVIRDYIPIDALLDPLTSKIDIESDQPNTIIYSSYALWFGWHYNGLGGPLARLRGLGPGAQPGMKKLGDRWGWAGRSFDLMASDNDWSNIGGQTVIGSHPDENGLMSLRTAQNAYAPGADVAGGEGTVPGATYTFSRWVSQETAARGAIDMNAARADGSVSRWIKVKFVAEPLFPVPLFDDTTAWPDWKGYVPHN